jgi:hypothetical protein
MCEGKRDDERRALPFAFAGGLNGAAMQFDEMARERKAQTEATGGAVRRRFSLPEALEDERQRLRRNTDACVR